MTNEAVPNPGSPEAIARGCWCAVLDNHHGDGFPWPDRDNVGKSVQSFWVTSGCPLHSPKDKADG